jgi:hypothetical protein
MRRWAALPLERVVMALEEMQELAGWLHPGVPAQRSTDSTSGTAG